MESWSVLPFTNKNWEEQDEKALHILQRHRYKGGEKFILICFWDGNLALAVYFSNSCASVSLMSYNWVSNPTIVHLFTDLHHKAVRKDPPQDEVASSVSLCIPSLTPFRPLGTLLRGERCFKQRPPLHGRKIPLCRPLLRPHQRTDEVWERLVVSLWSTAYTYSWTIRDCRLLCLLLCRSGVRTAAFMSRRTRTQPNIVSKHQLGGKLRVKA